MWVSWQDNQHYAEKLSQEKQSGAAEVRSMHLAHQLSIAIHQHAHVSNFTIIGDSTYTVAGTLHQSNPTKDITQWKALHSARDAIDFSVDVRHVRRTQNRAPDECCNALLDGREPAHLANDALTKECAHTATASSILDAARSQRKPTWTVLPYRVQPFWKQLIATCVLDFLREKEADKKKTRLAVIICAPVIFLRRSTQNKTKTLCADLRNFSVSPFLREQAIIQFLEEAQHPTDPHPARGEDSKYRACEELIKRGATKKALQVLSPSVIAPPTPQNIDNVRQTLRQGAPQPNWSSEKTPQIQRLFTPSNVFFAARSTKTCKAKGVNGWTRELFMPTLSSDACAEFWATYINDMIYFDLDATMQKHHGAGVLAPFFKDPQLRAAIRPVIIGCYLLKVAWRVVGYFKRAELRQVIPSNQAIQLKDGIRRMVRAIQAALAGGKVVMIADCSGAFCALARGAVQTFLNSRLDAFSALFRLEYEQQSVVWYNNGLAEHMFDQLGGITQGSVQSSAFFGAVTGPAIENRPAWGATDDIAIFATPDKLMEEAALVREQYASMGLEIIGPKTFILAPTTLHHLLAEEKYSKIVVKSHSIVLGAFIAAEHVSATPADFTRLHPSHSLIRSILPHLNTQTATCLVRGQCARWLHAFMCSEPAHMTEVANWVTDDIIDLFHRALRISPGQPSLSSTQLLCPLASGGCGLVDWSKYHRTVFSSDNVRLALFSLATESTQNWHQSTQNKTRASLMSFVQPDNKSGTGPLQRSWMDTYPLDSRDHFNSDEFGFAVKLLCAYPMTVMPKHSITEFRCEAGTADDNVDHVLRCPKCQGGNPITRHNMICAGITKLFNMHHLHASTNLRAQFAELLSRDVEGPDIVVYLPNRVVYVLDFTVKHIGRDESRANALKEKETAKKRKYDSTWTTNTEDIQLQFAPIVVTTTGQLSRNSIATLMTICKLAPVHGLLGSLISYIATSVLKLTHFLLTLRHTEHDIVVNMSNAIEDSTHVA